MSCKVPTIRTFRIDQAHLPATHTEADSTGFMLLHSGIIANELGESFAFAMQELTGYAPTPIVQQALQGSVDWRIEIATCDGDNDVRVRVGEPDADDPRAVGTITDDDYTAQRGCARIPLGTLTDAVGGAPPGWVTADRLAVDLHGDTELDGHIGMMVAAPPTAIAIADALAPFLTKNLAAGIDTGELMGIDANGDNVITTTELQMSSIFESLTVADGTLTDFTDIPRCPDDVTQWISVGLAVHATAL